MKKINLKQKSLVILILLVFLISLFQSADIVRAATFVEPFINTNYKDAANTTADWEADTATAHLINGDWRRANELDTPTAYEQITIGSALDTKVITGPIGQPIITYHIGNTMEAITWTNGAGTIICGGIKTSCWTNIAGTSTTPDSYTLPVNELYEYFVIRLSSGYPGFAIRTYLDSPSGHNALFYMQYTEGVGFTNADGITSGAEQMSTSSWTVDKAGYKFKLDNYSQPSLFWVETNGTTYNYYFTRLSGEWKYADRTTSGIENVLSFSATSTSANQLEFHGQDIYIMVKNPSTSYWYLGKWDNTQTRWEDLDDSVFASAPGNLSDLTLFRECTNYETKVHVSHGGIVYAACAYGPNSYLGQRISGDWKYADGNTSGIEDVFGAGANMQFIDFSFGGNGNLILWTVYRNVLVANFEIYLTQWNGLDWVNADGQTIGSEQVSTVSNGTMIDVSYYGNYDKPYTLGENNYPLFLYSDFTSSPRQMFFSRFTGDDIKGADKTTDDQDEIVPNTIILNYLNVYFDSETKDIFAVANANNSAIVFTKFNADKYDVLDQDLVSTTIAVPHNNASQITSATLTAADRKPAGTAITYYMSADGGSNWETVTSGVLHNFTNPGDDLRWKVNFSSSSEDSSPLLDYLYIDADAKTAGTSGDVTIRAEVDPELSLSLSGNSCDFGSFTSDVIKACSYSAIVSTNATNGYIGFIKAAGDFSSASYTIPNITAGIGANDTKIDVGYEEYGIATSDTDTVDITAKVSDCGSFNNGTTPVDAVAMSTADQSFAYAADVVSNDTITVCHSASIASDTPAGVFSQTITITVVGNF